MTDDIVPYDAESVRNTIWHARKIGYPWETVRDMVMEKHDLVLDTMSLVQHYRAYAQNIRHTVSEDEREIAREMELARLDELHRSWWEDAMMRDKDAARIILETMKVRHKLLGLDLPNVADAAIQQTVLVIGNDKQEWLDALDHGREHGAVVPGVVVDDGGDNKEGA